MRWRPLPKPCHPRNGYSFISAIKLARSQRRSALLCNKSVKEARQRRGRAGSHDEEVREGTEGGERRAQASCGRAAGRLEITRGTAEHHTRAPKHPFRPAGCHTKTGGAGTRATSRDGAEDRIGQPDYQDKNIHRTEDKVGHLSQQIDYLEAQKCSCR